MLTIEEIKTIQDISKSLDCQTESAIIVAVTGDGTRMYLGGSEPEAQRLKTRLANWFASERRGQ